MNKIIWKLPSNDGWDSISCEFKGTTRENKLIAAITCQGNCWDRAQSSDEINNETELTEDFSLLLLQVIITYSQLEYMKEILDKWLTSPAPISISFGDEHQSLLFDFDKQENVISSIEKPVCTMHYKTSRLESTIRFVTDQSCIRIAMTMLSEWLAEK